MRFASRLGEAGPSLKDYQWLLAARHRLSDAGRDAAPRFSRLRRVVSVADEEADAGLVSSVHGGRKRRAVSPNAAPGCALFGRIYTVRQPSSPIFSQRGNFYDSGICRTVLCGLAVGVAVGRQFKRHRSRGALNFVIPKAIEAHHGNRNSVVLTDAADH
jgi:hypothetical protein